MRFSRLVFKTIDRAHPQPKPSAAVKGLAKFEKPFAPCQNFSASMLTQTFSSAALGAKEKRLLPNEAGDCSRFVGVDFWGF